MYQILGDNYYNEKYLVQTGSQAKSRGTKLLKVHGMRKNLDPYLKPEKQHAMHKNGNIERLHIGQGSAESRRKRLESINQKKTNNMHSKDLTHSINNTNGKMTNRDLLIPDVPFHPSQTFNPLPELIKQNVSYPKRSQGSTDIDNINPNFNLEENYPVQEGIMSETFQRLDKSFFQEPKELGSLINRQYFNS